MEACFDSDGRADLGFVYDVAAALGNHDQPVRLAIRRIESAGLANQIGRGRAGVLVRSTAGTHPDPVTAGRLRQARRLEMGEVPWDGMWRLTAFTLPEGRRSDRDALRSALTRFGGVPISPALYLSTHDPRPPIRHYASLPDPATVDQLIVAEVARIDIAGLTDPSEIVERFWDLQPTLTGYEVADRALDRFERAPIPTDPVQRAAAALELSEPFAAALAGDPLLPPPLLPSDWPPHRVRARFVSVWSRLAEGAPDIDLYHLYAPDVRTEAPEDSTHVELG